MKGEEKRGEETKERRKRTGEESSEGGLASKARRNEEGGQYKDINIIRKVYSLEKYNSVSLLLLHPLESLHIVTGPE